MKKSKLSKYLSKYGIYFVFIILLIILSIASPAFLSSRNLINLLRQTSIVGIVAAGMTFVIISGGIDLSVGSVMALSSVVACSLSNKVVAYPLAVALLIGLLIGIACGVFNGFVINKWKIAPFIATLSMMIIARGIILVYTNGDSVKNLTPGYKFIGQGTVVGIPVPIIIFAAVVIISIYFMTSTRFGRYVYAIGGNENATIVSGVNVPYTKVIIYAISGLTSAIGGIVLSSRIATGQPTLGEGYELDAIAAVVIGGTSLSGAIGKVQGTLIGALLIGSLNNGLDMLNVSSYFQQIIKGAIIILAVLLDKKITKH